MAKYFTQINYKNETQNKMCEQAKWKVCTGNTCQLYLASIQAKKEMQLAVRTIRCTSTCGDCNAVCRSSKYRALTTFNNLAAGQDFSVFIKTEMQLAVRTIRCASTCGDCNAVCRSSKYRTLTTFNNLAAGLDFSVFIKTEMQLAVRTIRCASTCGDCNAVCHSSKSRAKTTYQQFN